VDYLEATVAVAVEKVHGFGLFFFYVAVVVEVASAELAAVAVAVAVGKVLGFGLFFCYAAVVVETRSAVAVVVVAILAILANCFKLRIENSFWFYGAVNIPPHFLCKKMNGLHDFKKINRKKKQLSNYVSLFAKEYPSL